MVGGVDVSTKIKQSGQDQVLICIIYIILFFCSIITIYPFINIIAKSFSGYEANITGRVFLIPVDFQINTFKKVVLNSGFFKSFWVSFRVAIMGTALSILVSGMAAYALSRPRLRGRKFFTVMFVFTMMFNGGMVPNYILIRSLGLLNKLSALFIPNAISVYNMLILKSAFESIPIALEESAKIDGAKNFTIFYRIMIPITIPSIAAVSLFLVVGYWNEYWSALMYITDNNLKPLQMYLFDVINHASDPLKNLESSMLNMDSPEGIKAATILASTVPILLVYPFIQKYFVKGVMIGSVKE